MAEGPTTFNGPLHDDAASLGGKQMTAFFSTPEEAEAARDALVADGLDPACVTITAADAAAPALHPADDTVLGHIREALLPDDSTRATRKAISAHEVMLTVIPTEETVDRIIGRIQASKPSRFDADLERWRNSQPSA